MPSGIITFHLKTSHDETHQCFVPLRIKNKYLICTTFLLMTPSSQVGMVIGEHGRWASMLDLVEQCREKSDDIDAFVLENIEGPLCFFPLVEKEPSIEETKQLWSMIRDRAVDLESSINEVALSETAVLKSYNLGKDHKMTSNPQVLKVLSREKLYNVYRWLAGAQLFYFKLDRVLKVSDLGAPLFRNEISRKDQVSKSFLGVYGTNIDYHDDKDYKVLIDPITILQLYEQHLHLPISKRKQPQSSPNTTPALGEMQFENNDVSQTPPSS